MPRTYSITMKSMPLSDSISWMVTLEDDRHLAVETRIPRAVDFTHPARGNEGQDLLRPECGAGLEAHEWRHY